MKKSEYPLTLSAIKDDQDHSREVFLNERPHNGAFVDVFLLEGCFLFDCPGEIFESLKIGEKLFISPEENSKSPMPPLMITMADGTAIGKIPYAAAILPNMLLSRGIKLWCYSEAKEFNGGMLEIAVSLYSEKY